MKIRFDLQCPTRWGQEVCVKVNETVYSLNDAEGSHWYVEIDIPPGKIHYKYQIVEQSQVQQEFGEPRFVDLSAGKNSLSLTDTFRSQHSLDNLLYTAPFLKSFFARSCDQTRSQRSGGLEIELRHVRVDKDQQIGILGSSEEFGAWDEKRVLLLDDRKFPEWSGVFDKKDDFFEYKYVLCDAAGKVIQWEKGDNRVFYPKEGFDQQVIHDEYADFQQTPWKAAGVALPVFSLRTDKSAGVGEFTDIQVMIDWMAEVGFKVFQTLPINDTVASHSWWDSYPYAAISVHALHPAYGNMEAIGPLKDRKAWEKISKQAKSLNKKEAFDYEAVMKLKSAFYKLSYDENKDIFLPGKELKKFLADNASWIYDYAVFSCLRDRFKTPDFHSWGEFAEMTKQEVLDFASPKLKHYDDVAVHYYIQYHLDKQLKAATAYGRKKGVVLKGDIPIGIFRHSVEAWSKPKLFQLNQQAGAPPDMFSNTGQNWGFPTYNWDEMEKDGYLWWKERFQKMSEYFDIIRLDHILGFFRIWQMPANQIQGLLGTFYPAKPFSKEEFADWDIKLDLDQYATPLIHEEQLEQLAFKEIIKRHFLVEKSHGWGFPQEMLSQHVVADKIESLAKEQKMTGEMVKALTKEVFQLQSEVLFIKDTKNGFYHPRIDLYNTFRFSRLDDQLRSQMRFLHDFYFHHRHNDFWKVNAEKKLPVLRDASDMLLCGEDLGMVPASVGPLLNELQILQLNVQPFPEYSTQFHELNYLSVKAPSNHDMFTLRLWWKHDPDGVRRFYHGLLGRTDEVPDVIDPEIAETLTALQLEANSMLVVFPLQDLTNLDPSLLSNDPEAERINVPENPKNVWKYRFHMNIGELSKQERFNDKIKSLLAGCKRLLLPMDPVPTNHNHTNGA